LKLRNRFLNTPIVKKENIMESGKYLILNDNKKRMYEKDI
jgi:hypothetical protein